MSSLRGGRHESLTQRRGLSLGFRFFRQCLANRLLFLATSPLLDDSWSKGLNVELEGVNPRFQKESRSSKEVRFYMYQFFCSFLLPVLRVMPCCASCPLWSLSLQPSSELQTAAQSLTRCLGVLMPKPRMVRVKENEHKQRELLCQGWRAAMRHTEAGRKPQQLKGIAEVSQWKEKARLSRDSGNKGMLYRDSGNKGMGRRVCFNI